MGNYKFRFSHMLPHAWFYKLKNMTPAKLRNLNSMHKSFNNSKRFHPKTKSTSSFTSSGAIAPPENSLQTHHFHGEVNNVPPPSHHLSEAPRKSTKKRGCTKKTRASPVTSSASSEYVSSKLVSTPEKHLSYFADGSSFDDSGLSDLDSEFERQKVDSRVKCRAKDNKPIFKKEFELKPIITKKSDNKGGDYGIGLTKKFQRNNAESSCRVRNATVNSSGVKLRTNSPRVGTKRVGQVHGRKSVSSDGRKSMASQMKNVIVVKNSFVPHIDLKKSMVEMILENNIRTLKDLETLLVCYLSLNSSAYHNLIVKLFEQIWFEIADIK